MWPTSGSAARVQSIRVRVLPERVVATRGRGPLRTSVWYSDRGRWMVFVYLFEVARERVVVVTVQDARSPQPPPVNAERGSNEAPPSPGCCSRICSRGVALRSLRSKLRVSCSLWLEQPFDPDSEAVGQRVEDVQGWIALASFDGADVGTVQMCPEPPGSQQLCQALSCQLHSPWGLDGPFGIAGIRRNVLAGMSKNNRECVVVEADIRARSQHDRAAFACGDWSALRLQSGQDVPQALPPLADRHVGPQHSYDLFDVDRRPRQGQEQQQRPHRLALGNPFDAVGVDDPQASQRAHARL